MMDDTDGGVLGISYTTWQEICSMYLNIGAGTKSSYLQWFPFTKLTGDDARLLQSTDFYEKYIKSASFVLFDSLMEKSDHYLLKGDGTFREAFLVSPVLYLVLQAIGMEISKRYVPSRQSDISVYYAGNYCKKRAKYKKDYDDFYKKINASLADYPKFIKTDISNFFSDIKLNKLIERIDAVCNCSQTVFSSLQLQLYKELFSYCGDEKFPLIENGISSSYLATIVYLDKIDEELYKYIMQSMPQVASFKMVRYVDDLYILLAVKGGEKEYAEVYNEIRNEYSSLLKEWGLTLNAGKCCLKDRKEINIELKKSLYDERVNGIRKDMGAQFNGSLLKFMNNVSAQLSKGGLGAEEYNKIIENSFSCRDIEFTSNEVFNYFVYEEKTEVGSPEARKALETLLRQGMSFVEMDPKRWMVLIARMRNERAIKSILNHLFQKGKNRNWNAYDATIAITYLTQRKFKHMDLLEVVKALYPKLYEYCQKNCLNSILIELKREERGCVGELHKVIAQDYKAHILFFLFRCQDAKKNHMAAFAYYKSFFDRVTADLDSYYNNNQKSKEPNYKGFYREGDLKRFYKQIPDSENTIQTAQRLRHANPLTHSSSELFEEENGTREIKEIIQALKKLIFSYIVENLSKRFNPTK